MIWKMKVVEIVCLTLYIAMGVSSADVMDELSNVVSLVENRSKSFVSKGITDFSMKLFKETVKVADSNLNIVLSPFSIWALLVLIMEGSKGKTKEQFQTVLGLPDKYEDTIADYRIIEEALKVNTTMITMETVKAIFSDTSTPLQQKFHLTMEYLYKCPIVSINFRESLHATRTINEWVSQKTHGKIHDLVLQEDLRNAELFAANAVYFQGQWALSFNQNFTKKEPFYDENGNILGFVDMMFSQGPYSFKIDGTLRANVIEMPYGKENRLSMIVMLPRFGNNVDGILEKLPGRNISQLVEDLAYSQTQYMGDCVKLWLPRFKTTSDFIMNVVLRKMGLTDVFNENLADLSGISSHNIYLSRVIHKTVISVDEKGTMAASVTGGSLINRSVSPKFRANRPFIYLIYEKTTNTVAFIGKISKPS